MSLQLLPTPAFYDASHAHDDHYHPTDIFRLQQEALSWRMQYQLKNVGADARRVELLVIDNQNDFDFPSGSLYVGGRSGTGAMDDQGRLAEFIYQHLAIISGITCTMDSHHPYQVFFPSAHVRKDGSHPDPLTMISAADYQNGLYRPNPAMVAQLGANEAWLTRQFIYYCTEVEKKKKFPLTVWPYHCLVGSHGHPLAGVVDEARLFHSFARGAANVAEVKGVSALTEHYSIFQPEVLTTWEGNPIPGAQRNTRLLKKLLDADMVIITGQAWSHCLAWSISDLLTEILAKDKSLAQKIYLLEDCTSAVVVPGVVDFTDQAIAAFDEFRNAGMHLVRTDQPMESWPGVAAQIALAA